MLPQHDFIQYVVVCWNGVSDATPLCMCWRCSTSSLLMTCYFSSTTFFERHDRSCLKITPQSVSRSFEIQNVVSCTYRLVFECSMTLNVECWMDHFLSDDLQWYVWSFFGRFFRLSHNYDHKILLASPGGSVVCLASRLRRGTTWNKNQLEKLGTLNF